MSARHAVLGLVIERPGYGYDLAQRLRARCGSWAWQSTGVYSSLDKLERDGHVLSDRVKGGVSTTRAAPRAIYEATPSGRDYFRDWILAPSSSAPVRHVLDLKIALASPELLPEMVEQFWAQEQQCIDQLHRLTAVPLLDVDARWRDLADKLLRDREIGELRARVEWLQNARKVVQHLLGRQAGSRVN